MNTTRVPKFFFVSALMITALVALQACTTSVTARESGQTSVGMGDLHRFEFQASNPAYTGMGDLHRFEAQNSGSSYTGMGDLHRFEAGQEIQYAGESNSPSP